MTAIALVTYLFLFTFAETLNFNAVPVFFSADIQIPAIVCFAVRFKDARLYLCAVFTGVLAGLAQGHMAWALVFSLTAAFAIYGSTWFVMISSHRFIAASTFMLLFVKTVAFGVARYHGQSIPPYFFHQPVFFILGNALCAPLWYEALDRMLAGITRVYEKNLHHA